MILKQHLTFDACHRLLNYDGSCKNCHGHTWSVDIQIESNRLLDTCGMLIDYRSLKNYVKETWDHRAILNMDDPLVDVFKSMGLNVSIMPGNPTAENIANKILADMIIMANLDTDIDHCNVIVRESYDNSAEVGI